MKTMLPWLDKLQELHQKLVNFHPTRFMVTPVIQRQHTAVWMTFIAGDQEPFHAGWQFQSWQDGQTAGVQPEVGPGERTLAGQYLWSWGSSEQQVAYPFKHLTSMLGILLVSDVPCLCLSRFPPLYCWRIFSTSFLRKCMGSEISGTLHLWKFLYSRI